MEIVILQLLSREHMLIEDSTTDLCCDYDYDYEAILGLSQNCCTVIFLT